MHTPPNRKPLSEVRWGILGCGDVTERKSGPAFNQVEGSRLVAVMRLNADAAADYAQRHEVPRWYSDADELIQDPEVNAVYIATPPGSHAELALIGWAPWRRFTATVFRRRGIRKTVQAADRHPTPPDRGHRPLPAHRLRSSQHRHLRNAHEPGDRRGGGDRCMLQSLITVNVLVGTIALKCKQAQWPIVPYTPIK